MQKPLGITVTAWVTLGKLWEQAALPPETEVFHISQSLKQGLWGRMYPLPSLLQQKPRKLQMISFPSFPNSTNPGVTSSPLLSSKESSLETSPPFPSDSQYSPRPPQIMGHQARCCPSFLFCPPSLLPHSSSPFTHSYILPLPLLPPSQQMTHHPTGSQTQLRLKVWVSGRAPLPLSHRARLPA